MSDVQLELPYAGSDSAVEWTWTDDLGHGSVAMEFVHATVMRAEVVEALAPRPGGVYLDATLGGGGHTEAILEREPDARVIAFDRDPAALAAAGARLACFGDRVTFVRTPFGRIREALGEVGLRQVDGVCADLGVSSPQLDDPSRGMSFRHEGPVDMRMDPDAGETALELIDRLSDEELADVIFKYGDERRSRRIARSVKRAVDDGEVKTTLDLRRAIVRAVGPARVGGVDPATRTFQALRIAVNRELEELESLLGELAGVVVPEGRVAIISFHSLEDRLVKRALHQSEGWEPLWKKPMGPSDLEQQDNPRARSAKLRAARRVVPFAGDAQ
jgi:16S rRNA (cytosine1402-N4)-methyltransferase